MLPRLFVSFCGIAKLRQHYSCMIMEAGEAGNAMRQVGGTAMTLRVGIIGLGFGAEVHLPAFTLLPDTISPRSAGAR